MVKQTLQKIGKSDIVTKIFIETIHLILFLRDIIEILLGRITNFFLMFIDKFLKCF